MCVDPEEVLASEGRIAEARAWGEEALEGARKTSEQESIGLSEAALAQVAGARRQFPESIARYAEAVRILRPVGEPWALGTKLVGLGDAQLEHGDAAAARQSFEEARDLDRQISFAHPEVEAGFASFELGCRAAGGLLRRGRGPR